MPTTITDLEVLEDFTSTARCDEGFLHVRRLWCRNVRSDGSQSLRFRVDVVDRPNLDAVAVLIHRGSGSNLQLLTRQNLRPAAHFRREKRMILPDGRSHLFVEEIVAGIVEAHEQGEEGLRQRAAEEVFEEAGFPVEAKNVHLMGSPFFLAPGILSEKVFLARVDVTGLNQEEAEGDGSPLEEGSSLRWWAPTELRAACRDGRIQDAKTEIAVVRFLEATGQAHLR